MEKEANGQRPSKSKGQQQWFYLTVKKLPASLRGITSKNNDDLCCQNCLNSFRKKKEK